MDETLYHVSIISNEGLQVSISTSKNKFAKYTCRAIAKWPKGNELFWCKQRYLILHHDFAYVFYTYIGRVLCILPIDWGRMPCTYQHVLIVRRLLDYCVSNVHSYLRIGKCLCVINGMGLVSVTFQFVANSALVSTDCSKKNCCLQTNIYQA